MRAVSAERVKELARRAGFELAGVAPAEPTLEALFYPEWIERGYAGEMNYLKGRRGEMRADPKTLLPTARSVICLGLVYNAPEPYSTEADLEGRGWISRYAWGEDYHRVMKEKMRRLTADLREEFGPFDAKICVDTSPLLERAYARRAGLGWIAKNTCLINEELGSWFFLGEILTSLDLAPDSPVPSRCGTCTRCIEACPTRAIVPNEGPDGPPYALDSTRCISYWTIELRGAVPEEDRPDAGAHVFGCDICQDVCPWNRPERAATTQLPEFQPREAAPRLDELAELSEEEFRERFAPSPVERARYRGFLRNVAVAMGASGNPQFGPALDKLANNADPLVREHAEWAQERLRARAPASRRA